MTAKRSTARHPKGSSFDHVTEQTLVEIGPATPEGTGPQTRKPLTRRDVYLNGQHIGSIVQHEVHTTATVTGHRYTRTLGYPIRWGMQHPTIRGLHHVKLNGMHEAALRLADEHLSSLLST